MYGRICVCECAYLRACVFDGVCVCKFHTLHKQVRISYFIQTGALILKSEYGGVVVGGEGGGRLSTLNFQILLKKYIQINVRIGRVSTYALFKLFINPSHVVRCYWRGRLCFGRGRDRGFVLYISLYFGWGGGWVDRWVGLRERLCICVCAYMCNNT